MEQQACHRYLGYPVGQAGPFYARKKVLGGQVRDGEGSTLRAQF